VPERRAAYCQHIVGVLRITAKAIAHLRVGSKKRSQHVRFIPEADILGCRLSFDHIIGTGKQLWRHERELARLTSASARCTD
jgi:hypothetical protein